ncbi:unnamed protein product [Lymnaea stagnalis]|uniref:Uncharacterized protein n=1 Tax=Lymnaea stagnalis TaxID=6523 RepID=A0AAV2H8V0_LYMST
MHILPGHLLGIVLILAIEKPAYIDADRTTFYRVTTDPLDASLGKKSCSDGYVHGIDNFIVSGFVNLTGTHPRDKHATWSPLVGPPPDGPPAPFCIFYGAKFRTISYWHAIKSTCTWKENCTGIQQVPLDKCQCKYESDTKVRVKCNLTADEDYFRTRIMLALNAWGVDFSVYQLTPKMYMDTRCKMRGWCDLVQPASSTNGGTSLLSGNGGMCGQVLLLTALMCGVSPNVFNGP